MTSTGADGFIATVKLPGMEISKHGVSKKAARLSAAAACVDYLKLNDDDKHPVQIMNEYFQKMHTKNSVQQLNELLSQKGHPALEFRKCQSKGPPHQPIHSVEVEFESHTYRAQGSTLQEAKNKCAKEIMSLSCWMTKDPYCNYPMFDDRLLTYTVDLDKPKMWPSFVPYVAIDMEADIKTKEFVCAQIAIHKQWPVFLFTSLTKTMSFLLDLLKKYPHVKIVALNAAIERKFFSSLDVTDLYDLLCKKEWHKPSLSTLSKHFLGLDVDKSLQTSFQSQKPLEKNQITYAIRDAYILFLLCEKIIK
jgi:Double-stranded RNA binding motif/3'-5' exonuclease